MTSEIVGLTLDLQKTSLKIRFLNHKKTIDGKFVKLISFWLMKIRVIVMATKLHSTT